MSYLPTLDCFSRVLRPVLIPHTLHHWTTNRWWKWRRGTNESPGGDDHPVRDRGEPYNDKGKADDDVGDNDVKRGVLIGCTDKMP